MAANVYMSAGKLRVVSEDFFGPCVRSPLGDYVLAWENARVDRTSGEVTRPGRWFLLQDQRIRIRGTARKVLCADLANPGTFVIACGPRRPGALEGTVYVVERDGSVLIKERLAALPGAAAIADDGSYAVCQATLGRPEGSDTGRLLLLDVDRRTVAWRLRPPRGWASRLEVDPRARVILAGLGPGGGGGCYRYSLEGDYLGTAADHEGTSITELKPDARACADEGDADEAEIPLADRD